MSEDIQANTDELLISAFLDGELSDEQNAQFENLMANDAAFRNKVDQRQQQQELIAQAFNQIDSEPMPQSVMAMLEQKNEGGNKVETKVVTLQRKKQNYAPFAMAASVLLVGVLTVFYFGAEKQTTSSVLLYRSGS